MCSVKNKYIAVKDESNGGTQYRTHKVVDIVGNLFKHKINLREVNSISHLHDLELNHVIHESTYQSDKIENNNLLGVNTCQELYKKLIPFVEHYLVSKCKSHEIEGFFDLACYDYSILIDNDTEDSFFFMYITKTSTSEQPNFIFIPSNKIIYPFTIKIIFKYCLSFSEAVMNMGDIETTIEDESDDEEIETKKSFKMDQCVYV